MAEEGSGSTGRPRNQCIEAERAYPGGLCLSTEDHGAHVVDPGVLALRKIRAAGLPATDRRRA
jgi:hypothetical protein